MVRQRPLPAREHPLAHQLRKHSAVLDGLVALASLPPSHGQTEQLLDGVRQLSTELAVLSRGRS
jgi:hypothetical protein